MPRPNDFSELAIDEDGLWICRDCGAKTTSPPLGQMAAEDLGKEISALAGKSAGAMRCISNPPYKPPYRSIIDDASRMQDYVHECLVFCHPMG